MNAFWKNWGGTVSRVFSQTAAFASMAGLFIAFSPDPPDWSIWVIILVVLGVIFYIVTLTLEILGHRGRSVFPKSDSEGIRRYMHRWIEHGGRVAIWTRDMSWAENSSTKSLLCQKAQNGELILILPEPNALAEELRDSGAEVCGYGAHRLELPASRFTISYFGRVGSRLAVGRAEGDTHVIDEFSAGHHPAFHIAADLIALARSLKVSAS